jgi:acyl carrier protein
LKFNIEDMIKSEFIEKIKEILLIEGEIGFNHQIKIDSLASLMLIEFYDENFGFRLTSDLLSKMETVGDLYKLVKDRVH